MQTFSFEKVTDENIQMVIEAVGNDFGHWDVNMRPEGKARVIISSIMGQPAVTVLSAEYSCGYWRGELNLLVLNESTSDRPTQSWNKVEVSNYMQSMRVSEEAFAEAEAGNYMERYDGDTLKDARDSLLKSYADIYFNIWWNEQIDKLNSKPVSVTGAFGKTGRT